MKKFYSLFLTTLLVFGFINLQAQDKNNPWQFSFGINAVDVEADSNTQFADFFNVNENWNTAKSPISMFTISKYLGDNLSFGLGASFNSISKYATGSPNGTDMVSFMRPDVTNDYFSVDAMLKYDLSDALPIRLIGMDFEPFVGVGPGWTWFDDQDGLTGNLSLGVNHWFNDVFGFTLMVDYKHNMDDLQRWSTPILDEGGTMRWSAMLSVKFGGTDTDGDGIYDDHDECPEIAGLEEFNGCPDSDGDGIKDSEDDCPMLAGLIEFNGCPDTDGDGIADNKDRCPKVAGLESMGGCPDTDGDGIADGQDACPKVAGPRGNRGCPWPDTDGDSVVDKDDECPEVPGTVANNGCPEGPTDEDMARITELSRGIQFAFGATTFTEGTPPVLDAIVTIILKYPNASFSVEGHTDSIGTKGFNQSLSEGRAAAVVNYLSGRNVSTNRLNAVGFGENNPIDTNVNSAGRANNRRVEILFVK